MEFSEMKRNTSNWSNFCMLLRRAGLTASAGLSCLLFDLITSMTWLLCYVLLKWLGLQSITDGELRHCDALCVCSNRLHSHDMNIRTWNYQPRVLTWCPAGSVINITSATVGFSRNYTRINHWECTISDNDVQCRRPTPTNSPKIMQCNGRQNCSLGHDAFDYPGTFRCDGRWPRGNLIKITYNCIAGVWTRSVVRFSRVIRWDNPILSQYSFDVLPPVISFR